MRRRASPGSGPLFPWSIYLVHWSIYIYSAIVDPSTLVRPGCLRLSIILRTLCCLNLAGAFPSVPPTRHGWLWMPTAHKNAHISRFRGGGLVQHSGERVKHFLQHPMQSFGLPVGESVAWADGCPPPSALLLTTAFPSVRGLAQVHLP